MLKHMKLFKSKKDHFSEKNIEKSHQSRVGNGMPYAAVYRGYRGYSRYTVSYGIIFRGCGLILSYRG